MSAQAGVFYQDGRVPDQAFVKRLAESIADFGADGRGEAVLPGLVMAYAGFHVTPEDSSEHQPVRSRQDHVLTWDGRLDNRDDLLVQLWRVVKPDASDAALVMAAYEKWGEAGFARLIGDWSLVLWDGVSRELKLASDYAGNRELFYWEGDGQLHWSTSLAELVDRIGVRDCLEPGFIVGYLTFAVPPDVTPYRDIWSVSPAHVLAWSAGKPKRKSRFWDLSVDTIRYRDPRDYQVQLRMLFGTAIKSRLRSTAPVWAELSGGLDSSCVVCTADRLMQFKEAVAPSLETLSYITDTSPESDERPFIAAVEEQLGRRSHYVKAEACASLVDGIRGWVTPTHPDGVTLEFFRTVRSHGGRVLITGHPGDLVMGNFPESSASLGLHFAERRPFAFLHTAREWSRASRRPIWHVMEELLTPYLPIQARTRRLLLHSLQGQAATTDSVLLAAGDVFLLTPERLQLWWDEKLRRTDRVARYGHRWQHKFIDGVVEYMSLRTFRSPSDFPHIVYTHAYTDRRLVEFTLGIPPDILNPPGQPRLLMKQAFGGLLPPKVARRFSKGYVDPFKLRKVRAWSSGLTTRLDSLHVVREGYVDRNRLAAKLRAVGDGSCRSLGNIEMVLKLERWVEARQERACGPSLKTA